MRIFQETIFSQGESEEVVKAWSEEIKKELSLADESVDKLSKCLHEIIKNTYAHTHAHTHTYNFI